MNRVQNFVLIGFTIAITSNVLITIGNNTFATEYPIEKCGVSIQYPEDWEVKNDDYQSEGIRSFVTISPDDFSNPISIMIWDITEFSEKSTIEYVSEVFRPAEDEIETEVIQDDILQVGDFPAQKLAYIEGIPGEYEFQEEKTHFMQINILAYDKLYQIQLETENLDEYYKYLPVVEEIANNIKISKPNFEGINC
jgi:hypothetical protein